MQDEHILAIILAGGEGTRLAPLTSDRSKPAVPFGGRYRIVDFVLSNMVNSEIYSIYVLVQYKSQSLIEHIRKAWVLAPVLYDHFVTVVPPQMRQGQDWFQGTADAVYQNLSLIRESRASLVLVFGADHIYRMDVRQMIEAHRANKAHVSVAALPVPRKEASGFGVMGVNDHGLITEWVENPADPPPMPGRPDFALASMGNYIFDADVLVEALQTGRQSKEKDFGRDVIPRLMKTHRVFSYDFSKNEVAGVRKYEEPAYWRDVGTLDAYFQANMDILGPEPRVQLFNREWPIRSSNYQGPPANFYCGTLENSYVAAGTRVGRATIRNSVVRRECTIADDVVIEDSIIMDYSVICKGARIKRAIVDRYNIIGANERIGYDLEADSKRYHVTDSGIVVLAMAQREAARAESYE